MTGYNGWKNYETWCVALWIDNEPGSYSQRVDYAANAWRDAPEAPQVASGVWTVSEAARFNLADTLKGWIEETAPDLPASMFSDLLRAALSDVDWSEIADNFLSETEGYERK